MRATILLLLASLLSACVVESASTDDEQDDPPGRTVERSSAPIDVLAKHAPAHSCRSVAVHCGWCEFECECFAEGVVRCDSSGQTCNYYSFACVEPDYLGACCR